jgi:hypothetical protein
MEQAHPPTSAIASLLSTVRALPVWMLAGLAAAGYAVLFGPAFGRIDPASFRNQWGVWVWIEALTFSALALARASDLAMSAYHKRRKTGEANRILRLVPRHHQCWWHLAKQQDDSFVSQIALDVEAANLTDRPVRIVKVQLIRPKIKGELLHGIVTLPKAGSPYHSDRHAVPPHDTVTASLHILVRGALGKQGDSIRVTFGITDQFGTEYTLKKILIRTHDPKLPSLPCRARLVSGLKSLPGIRSETELKPDFARHPLPEWQHQGKFDQADLILNGEKRNYAACGRSRGGLGSLNVTLQSEPNFGWAVVGSVPTLLWDRAQGKPVDSPNLARLMRLHATLDNMEEITWNDTY